MKSARKRWVSGWLVAVVALLSLPLSGGDGVVKVQSAAPACPSDSGDIYVDCGNGTVTDNRTGLVWLKNADCLAADVDWTTAFEFVAGLSDLVDVTQDCGLSDGSSPGEWRLPSFKEWDDMTANATGNFPGDPVCDGPGPPPVITNDAGDACWVEGPSSSFTGVQAAPYFSTASIGDFGPGRMNLADNLYSSGSLTPSRVWPVRGGQ